MALSPLNRRRLANFRANRRGYWSLWIFTALMVMSLFAELIANDRPLLVRYDGQFYLPVLSDYPETVFGGFLETGADYNDAAVQSLIREKGWIIWPPIPYSYDTLVLDLPGPAPSPPSWRNWLGTDDQARDVTARLIYGFRLSVLFGLILTILSSLIGIAAGAVQGYFGGWVDLLMQRFIEIWSGMPTLYLLIILASVITPSFWWLLGLMLLFSWMTLVGVVRAEFLRARNFDYVRAARALGVGDLRIIWRHVLPNAMVAALTFLPFVTSGAVVTLTAPRPVDFARRIVLQRAGSAAPVELYSAARERSWGLRARLHRAWTALFAPRARPTIAASQRAASRLIARNVGMLTLYQPPTCSLDDQDEATSPR